jgi:opacity protein-like surface antigen
VVIDVGYRFKAAMDVVTDDASNQEHNSSTFYTHTAQVGVSWKF